MKAAPSDSKSLIRKGGILFDRRLYPAAREAWQEALDLAEGEESPPDKARALNALGVLFLAQRDLEQALDLLSKALAILLESPAPDQRLLGQVYFNLGSVHWYAESNRAGLDALRSALAIFEAQGNRLSIARARLSLGALAILDEDFEEAAKQTAAALEIFQEEAQPYFSGIAAKNLGAIRTAQGDYLTADQHLRQAWQLMKEAGDLNQIAYTLTELSRLQLRQGRLAEAVRSGHRALVTLLSDVGTMDKAEAARIHYLFAEIFSVRGDYDKSLGYLQRAMAYYQSLGMRRELETATNSFATMQAARSKAAPAVSRDQETTGGRKGIIGPLDSSSPGGASAKSRRALVKEELHLKYLDTFFSLVDLLEEKEPYTRGHSERVTAYTLIMANELGLGEKDKETLAVSGRLHDVGKLTIDATILNKPGPLDERERLLVQRHPVAGAEMLRSTISSYEALAVIRHHHERFDGGGYPDGRQGQEIPLLTRILTVADAYDAMTSDRPYRPALSHSQALAELEDKAGTQFDLNMVDAFIRCHSIG